MSTPADVERYLTRTNEHDVPAALACLADSFELHFAGTEYAMTKDSLADALAWDAGVRGHNEWRVVEVDGPKVTVEGRETNEFLELLGIESLHFRSTYVVDDDGRIANQTPAPEGRMVYTEEMARRWVALAHRWREAET